MLDLNVYLIAVSHKQIKGTNHWRGTPRLPQSTWLQRETVTSWQCWCPSEIALRSWWNLCRTYHSFCSSRTSSTRSLSWIRWTTTGISQKTFRFCVEEWPCILQKCLSLGVGQKYQYAKIPIWSHQSAAQVLLIVPTCFLEAVALLKGALFGTGLWCQIPKGKEELTYQWWKLKMKCLDSAESIGGSFWKCGRVHVVRMSLWFHIFGAILSWTELNCAWD